MMTKASQAPIARQGWVADQRAARSGTRLREWWRDIGFSFFSHLVEGHLQPRAARARCRGPQDHTRGRPRSPVRDSAVGQNGDMDEAATPTPWAPPGRFRLTLYAGGHLLMVLPTLLFFIFTVVGGVLAIAWVGLPLLFLFVPASRWIANRHRILAEKILGTQVPAEYRPVPEGTHLPNRIVIYARDPMTWRDLAWMVTSLTVGFALSLLTFLLFVVIVTGALWWYGAEPIMQARARFDRALLSYG